MLAYNYDNVGNLEADASHSEMSGLPKVTERLRNLLFPFLIPDSTTTLQFNNYNWQVIAESASSGTLNKYVIYGNFIDEPVFAGVTGSYYYYLHDHLYNTAAIVNYNTGNVLERYEYNAYGKVYIYDANFTPKSATNYNNNILFTGRELDTPDSGDLKLQYNRNRYYCSRLGRWMTQDPLGITPNSYKYNFFKPVVQMSVNLNIYNYTKSNPIKASDFTGLRSRLDLRDFYFAYSFVRHRYFGRGRLWTSGVSNLKRQENIKLPVAQDLVSEASQICESLPNNGSCDEMNHYNNSHSGMANDTIWMEITLNGPHNFKSKGSYIAKKYQYGSNNQCACTVSFRLKYTWIDKGDLNYEHFADIALRFYEFTLPVYINNPFIHPTDFPIKIEWTDTCVITTMGSGSSVERMFWGWPVEIFNR